MSRQIIEIVDDDNDDDEVSVLYSTTKYDAIISVEDYKPNMGKRKIADDDESSKRMFFIGDSKSPTPTCEICTDETPSSDMFRVLGCSHSYCCACIVNYVASKLHDNISKINCPVAGCNGSLEPYHCRPILPKDLFDRWGDALCETVILGFERFYCPFNDCSVLLINDYRGHEAIRHSECPFCHRLFCWKCKVPWHSGITCERRMAKEDQGSKEGIETAKLAKRMKWQRCPFCGMYVERRDGCTVINCRCGTRFCYKCGSSSFRCSHHLEPFVY